MENTIQKAKVEIKSRIKGLFVGRGKKDDPIGTVAYVLWDSKNPRNAAHGAKEQFVPSELPLYAKLLDSINRELKGYIAENVTATAFDIYSMRQGVVLRYYQIAKALAAAKQNNSELKMESLYQDFMSAREREIVKDFAECVKTLLDSGNYIRLYDANLINYVELAVPEGVEIPQGTILKFDDGKATYTNRTGIPFEVATRDWPKFKRDRAVVQVFDADTEYPVYAVKFSARPTGVNEELLLAKAELFKACPAYVCNRVAEAIA